MQPINDLQVDRFKALVTALLDNQLQLRAVLFDGQPRACICIVIEDMDDPDAETIFPVALLLEDEDTQLLVNEDGEKPEYLQ